MSLGPRSAVQMCFQVRNEWVGSLKLETIEDRLQEMGKRRHPANLGLFGFQVCLFGIYATWHAPRCSSPKMAQQV